MNGGSRSYEDGEDGAVIGWNIYDNDPAGATIANVADSDRGSRVIELAGSAANNGFCLRNPDGSYWNDGNFKVMEWSMKYSDAFTVYIAVQTKNGFRYLYYTLVDADNLGTETYVHHGLGSHLKDGQWHTLVRDLARDLKEAQPDNELQAVLGFLIRGSGRVDDIKTRKTIPADQDSDGDGLDDKAEHDYWGANWNADPDHDGLVNLLDPDAANRAFAFSGGCCRRGIFDNMPTAEDQVLPGKARVFNRRFVQLCSHYLVEPVAGTPGSGWEKGQGERQVKSIREWLHPMLFITQCFSRIETRSL